MKPKHIIVGAGIGGLYTANALIRGGVEPEQLILTDPRAGIYTRPGHLSEHTFEEVSSRTGIRITWSPANHIKELERAMYHALREKGVRFVRETFVGLQTAGTEPYGKAVVTRKKDGSLAKYAADYVFDCTGSNAHVAHAVNDYQQQCGSEPVFHTTLLSDINPVKDHLVAQVSIPNQDALGSYVPLQEGSDGQPVLYRTASAAKNLEARERLRDLGWLHEAFPSFYTFPQQGTDKVCLYMETPAGLPPEGQPAWIKLLLSLYSDGAVADYSELKPSRKYATKPRIMGFQSIPYRLNRATFQSPDLPVVIIGFDALKGFDYRQANGVESGITCCERMLGCLTIAHGRIQKADTDAIEDGIAGYLDGEYKNILLSVYHYRQDVIDDGYGYFCTMYTKAALELPESETDRKQLYQAVAGEIAWQGVLSVYPGLENTGKTPLERLELLERCLGLLIQAREYIPASDTLVHHDINRKLLSVMKHLRMESESIELHNIRHFYKTKLLKWCENILSKLECLDGSVAGHAIRSTARKIMEHIQEDVQKRLSTLMKILTFSSNNIALTIGSPGDSGTISWLGFFATVPPGRFSSFGSGFNGDTASSSSIASGSDTESDSSDFDSLASTPPGI